MKKVLAGGCFNTVHPGHIYFLKEARALGDCLVVVLANDKHNKKPGAKPASLRKRMLEKTGIPGKVVVGDTEDYTKVVRDEKPDIIALGYDQRLPKGVDKKSIRTVRIKKFGDYTTSS